MIREQFPLNALGRGLAACARSEHGRDLEQARTRARVFHTRGTDQRRDVREALRRVIGSTASATLVAAATTVAGLAALALVSGVDLGPLVAVPLVAEFALVLCGGVVLAWLAGLFIALPLAVVSDRGRAQSIAPSDVSTQPTVRTAGVTRTWP